jgi:hypothetical protein
LKELIGYLESTVETTQRFWAVRIFKIGFYRLILKIRISKNLVSQSIPHPANDAGVIEHK